MRRGLLGAAGVVGASFAAAALLSGSTTTVAQAPGQPTHLTVVGQSCDPATQRCDVRVTYGPRQVDTLTPGAVTARSLIISWPPSDDELYAPVTYTFTKGSSTVARGISRTWVKVGFKPSVRTFRTCVWATNTRGETSPKTCATWTGALPANS